MLKWHAYAMATTGSASAHGVAPFEVSTATTDGSEIQPFSPNSATTAPATKSRTKNAAVVADASAERLFARVIGYTSPVETQVMNYRSAMK